VTEAEWLTATEPQALLEYLQCTASEHKLRLLAVACCRRLAHLKGREKSRNALSTVERYADGQADRKELLDARSRAWEAAVSFYAPQARIRVDASPVDALIHVALVAAGTTTNPWPDSLISQTFPAVWNAGPDNRSEFVAFIHDVFGFPFRPAPDIDARWLDGNGGVVRRVADAVYANRTFDDLPRLADALEDAGCTDVNLLGHLRGPGPHVRGCWALDLILGKA
jgi:hypothetical protein